MDNASFLECPICSESYDQTTRIPTSLNCGHTFCKICINNIGTPYLAIKCATCRKNSHSSSVNYALLAQLTTKATPKCKKHNKDLELICKICKISICSKCAREEEHKTHESIFWDDANLEIKKKFEANDDMFKELDMKKEAFKSIKEAYSAKLHILIEQKFKLLHDDLEKNEIMMNESIAEELSQIEFEQFLNQNLQEFEHLKSQ